MVGKGQFLPPLTVLTYQIREKELVHFIIRNGDSLSELKVIELMIQDCERSVE